MTNDNRQDPHAEPAVHIQGIAGEGVELGSTVETECGAESIAAIEDRNGPEGEHHMGTCQA